MQLSGKDQYRVTTNIGLSDASLSSLALLYQPLTGGDGILIYLTLFAERNGQHPSSLEKLFTLINISPDVFERSLVKLEEYMLVRTFAREEKGAASYIFVLNAPMNSSDFISNGLYMSRYLKEMGQEMTNAAVSYLSASSISMQGYKDVTHVVKNVREDTLERKVSFVKVRPSFTFDEESESINFDYEKFVSITTPTVFPTQFRTRENMALIGQLATVYGLTPERMRILVSKCSDLNGTSFDTEKLKVLCAKSRPEVTSSDPYDLPPVSFLQGKQNGVPVTFADKKILENLATEMHFANPVINVMVEYILSVSDNRLVRSFVESVAGEWARDGVKTKEDALAEAKKSRQKVRSNQAHIRIAVPDFIRQAEEGTLPKSEKASEKELQEAMDLQRKLRKQNG